MNDKILLADDDLSFLEIMTFLLHEEGYSVEAATSGTAALALLHTHQFGVMITDLKMPGLDGLALLKKTRELAPTMLTIVVTAYGDSATAVAAMKAGAFDFLPKPCDRDQFKLTVRRAFEHFRLQKEVRELRGKSGSEGKQLLFASKSMADLATMADRIAQSDATVLILGESGTGKELLARRIHQMSARKSAPFVAINCGSIPRELLESELFGHTKGAFTGAVQDRKGRFLQADHGTLFLDEIAELPIDLQTRLLRVLQEHVLEPVGAERGIAVDVRIIAATNRDLVSRVDSGEFRRDLFYRLNVIPLRVPPLRERKQDILPLLRHFLARYSSGREWVIPKEVLEIAQTMPWPGNVRELENFCQRAALLTDDGILHKALFDPELSTGSGRAPLCLSSLKVELPTEGISLVELERAILVKALEMNNYNQSATARFLAIPRHILLYRMEKYSIAGTSETA